MQRPAAWRERYEVQTDGGARQVGTAGGQRLGGAAKPVTLAWCHRIEGRFEMRSAFHFNNGDDIPLNGEYVDLSLRRLEPEAEDTIAFQHQPQRAHELAASAITPRPEPAGAAPACYTHRPRIATALA